jgi:hypothetical protein
MNERIRELFEEKVYPSFPGIAHGLRRKDNGEYLSDTLEDHWQTFQEGFEIAVRECCQKLENDGMVEVAMEMKEHLGVSE